MVVEIKYKEVHAEAPIEVDKVTIDHGASWITLEELVDKFYECKEPLIFFSHLDVCFGCLEKALIKKGWTNKYCKDNGKGWHAYVPALKDKCYTVRIFGNNRYCSQVKIGVNGRQIKIYNAANWIKGGSLPTLEITEEEYEFLLELSKRNDLAATPASNAKQRLGKLPMSEIKDLNFFYALRSSVQGGIISTLNKNGHYDIAYHYDITSMYPYIISTIDYFPLMSSACLLEEDEVADHNRYAYWVLKEYSYCCDIRSEIIPKGSIKMLLGLKNTLKKSMNELYQEKDKLTKKTPQYNVVKLMLNSFLGTLIQRDYCENFYPYVGSKEVIESPVKHSYKQRYEIYEYMIAKARDFIFSKMMGATNQGAEVLQVNTDGFFTNKPIKYDAEKFLGSMRLEYVAHNLTIYACNQYVCDEEVCIAGLPSSMYEPNKTNFSFLIAQFDEEIMQHRFKERKITLGEAVYA